ncbi:SDR family NAD(P)-dependent oxidoreductase [Aequorivita vladivostokensis]|uniref:Short-chain dehydrogenase n=1 Tax=Aequorivita vladivostokensis TaxID=171194 RepID=A0ABR5DG31_9FLAO|nr:SDR family oxidoreductase [Aequorivita vladivostokensis]KJJ37761.1 short-chain dehydrogenase [Aequorivita vladivostokensis]MBF31285.1 NAD(P)-dependent oxidoreductase [Aequorivita sp.]|tara:strand:+ start:25445 stop:26125 length:681 start_codon:yes stop_codon:yes gene_type:complete
MKNIIITGTSRGIGFEMVRLFSEAGYNVLALSRNSKPISDLKLKNVTALEFDIADESEIVKLSAYLQTGMKSVDVLINNAGFLVNKPFAEITSEEFKRCYDVNVFGVASLIKTVLPFMKKEGHVVSISSMGGVQGSVKFPGLSAYSSSKGAIITLTELLAEEYKETGPSFNVLALGSVQTEMLEEAFPGFKAPLSATEMAQYIMDFSLTGNKFYNGKILQVSSTTP